MASATDAFLSTPELVELVLLHCDMRSILTAAQRVSRQWREIVRTSPAVQTHLFLRPAEPPRIAASSSPQGSSSSNSSSSSINISSSSSSSTSSSSTGSRKSKDWAVMDEVETEAETDEAAPRLNPLLTEVFPPFFERFVINTSEGFWSRSEFAALPLARNPEPFMRREASWRRMHVQQPPLAALGVALPADDYTFIHEQTIHMGELYDHVLRVLTRGPGQQWRILFSRQARRGLEQHRTLLPEFNKPCTKKLLREVDVALVRSSDPFCAASSSGHHYRGASRSSLSPSSSESSSESSLSSMAAAPPALPPADRDFITTFTHPNTVKAAPSYRFSPSRRSLRHELLGL